MDILSNHIFLTALITIFALGVIIKSHRLYNKEPIKNLIFIAAGFTFSIFFELLHLKYSLSYEHLNQTPYYQNLEFLYIFASRFIVSASIIISSFFCFKNEQKDKTMFVIKTYLCYLLFSTSIVLFIQVGPHIFPNIQEHLLKPLIVRSPSLDAINNVMFFNNMLFLLSALIYTDIRRNHQLKNFSLFTMGLIILGLGQIYLISTEYTSSIHRVILHYSRAAGYALMLFGLSDISIKSEYFSLRQKIILFPTILLILVYATYSIYWQLIHEFTIETIVQYKYFIFAISTIMAFYLISSKFVQPINTLIKKIKTLDLEQKPEPIEITTNDEIGLLTKTINTLTLDNWNHLQNEKEISKRKQLLSKTIETIRSSFNIDEIKKEIVKSIGQSLKPDRVFIIEYDLKNERYIPIKKEAEYLSSPNIKSYAGADLTNTEGFEFIQSRHRKGEDVVYSNIEDFIEEQNLKGTKTEKFFRDYNLKTLAAMVISYGDEFLGNLVIQHTKENVELTEDYLEYISVLANQAAVAIYQAKLFEKERKATQKEKILKDIAIKTSETTDLQKTKQYIADIIGKYFDADRLVFMECDVNSSKYVPIKIEYLKSPDIKSYRGMNVESLAPEFIEMVKNGQEIYLPDIEKDLKEKGLEKTKSAKLIKSHEVKSDYALPAFYGGVFIGTVVMHYTKQKKIISNNEYEFYKTLVNQAASSIYKSMTYLKIQEDAKKERLFSKIVTTFRSYIDPNKVKKSIVSEIGKAFNADRCFFIEYDENETPLPVDEFSEYLKSKKEMSIVGFNLKNLNDKYWTEKLKRTKKEIIYTDFKNFMQEHEMDGTSAEKHFKNFNFNSGYGFPLFKGDKITGFFVLNFTKPMKLPTQDDINFLKTLVEQMDIAITQANLYKREKETAQREIEKAKEIEELRNTFILTLAHDLQVPLVGEQKALEFLRMRTAKDKEMEDLHEITQELIYSNESVIKMLKKILDNYKYESGQKDLTFERYYLPSMINQVTASLKGKAKAKSINMKVEIQDNISDVLIDINEVSKVVTNLIDNAIIYNNEGGEVTIKCSQINDKIETCVCDNGPGIPETQKEILFKRYEMALALERKIGSGLSLYICKQIIEANGGDIYFTSEENKGATFCFTLPIIKNK